ncbi:alpha/beta hydrolase [Aestuariivirga sp.]|uniref:alpha/beta hydrolase n=1 Tax=Aestuariivirga sp. TaxID=2650926 RepID=UPI00391C5304
MGKLGVLIVNRLAAPFSVPGMLLGAAAFLAALTPSLIPRAAPVQGAICGLSFAVAYGLGAGGAILWNWLGLFEIPAERIRLLRRIASWASLGLLFFGLSMAWTWQSSVHQALRLPPPDTAGPLVIAVVGLLVMVLLILLGRVFRLLKDLYELPFRRLLPPRASFLAAALLAAWSFWAVGNGFLLDSALRGLDETYRRIDALRQADEPAPSDPLKTGSSSSHIAWSGLGAEGRARILAAPSGAEIAELAGGPVREPVRVYAGLNSAGTPDERAELALKELIRAGGFERALLVIATPTGTGWVDPAAMMPLEILHRGDVATVSVQYSYLPSWLSLLVEPEYGHETARAVFRAVYGHWRALEPASRPRLYLFGLSLGSLNSDLSSDAFDIVGDPYHGAFWVGPPFASRTWGRVTAARLGQSPAWLPLARNGNLFRFMTNDDHAQLRAPDWGPLRILYLQYASDPIVFFEGESWRLEPAWMKAPRGPDVPAALTWIPGVTFLQLIFDMMTATTVPPGVGHVYAASDYLDGWVALTDPAGWQASEIEKLRAWLGARGI